MITTKFQEPFISSPTGVLPEKFEIPLAPSCPTGKSGPCSYLKTTGTGPSMINLACEDQIIHVISFLAD